MFDVQFKFLETMLFENGEFWLLERHLDRLERGTRQFEDRQFDKTAIRTALLSASKDWVGTKRVRLLYRVGKIEIEDFDFDNSPSLDVKKVVLDSEPTDADDVFLYHKTTHRKVYQDARERAGVGENGIFDVIMFNKDGDITECSIANIAMEVIEGNGDVVWVTPPISAGLLPGVLREELLAQGLLRERPISVEELKAAAQAGRRIKCFNSLRGEYFVELKL
eukprot:Colp12_sorted_trinity150504_noHs@6927